MNEKTFQLIDSLLTIGKDNRQMALNVMDNGEKGGDIQIASEIIGHRFCLNPNKIIDWYNERKTRLL